MRSSVGAVGAFAGLMLVASRSDAQVFFPYGMPSALEARDRISSTSVQGSSGVHRTIASVRPTLGVDRWDVRNTTPPTGTSPATAFGPSIGNFASPVSLSVMGTSLVSAWSDAASGGERRVVVTGLAFAPPPIVGRYGKPTVSCVSTACLEVHLSASGAVEGTVFNNATRAFVSLRGSSGGGDVSDPPAVAIVAPSSAERVWFVAASVAGTPRQVMVYRVEAPSAALTATLTGSFSALSTVNADDAAIARDADGVYVAARTGPSGLSIAWFDPNLSFRRAIVPVPDTTTATRASLGSGPNGALLAYINETGPGTIVVRRMLVRTGALYAPQIHTRTFSGRVATRLAVSSDPTNPLLVFDAPGVFALSLLETVGAAYLGRECATSMDCGSVFPGAAACQGTCVTEVCDFARCFSMPDSGVDSGITPADTGVDTGADTRTDTGVDSGVDTGVDTGVAMDSSAPNDVPSADVRVVDSGGDAPIAPPLDSGIDEDASIAPLDAPADVTIDAASDASIDAMNSSDGSASDAADSSGRGVRYGGGACACRAPASGDSGRPSRVALALGVALAWAARRRRRSAA